MGLEPGPAADKIFQQHSEEVDQLIRQRGFTWAENAHQGNIDKPYDKHNPDWTMDAALKFIEQNKDKPFYLHYCPTLLHGPDGSWRNSMDYPTYSQAGRVTPDPVWLTRRKEVLAKMKSLGMTTDGQIGIAWMDSNLGVLLQKLDELGLTKNTLIIFSPDHGSSAKGSLYARNGTWVPMLMRWPDGIPASSVCDELVQSIDLAPTFFELGGAKVPATYRMDGRSLMPLFATGKADTWRNFLYFEIGVDRAVMTKDWKYIATRYPKDDLERIEHAAPQFLPSLMSPLHTLGIGVRGASHPGFFDEDQLYNLRQDPGEMKNLAQNPEFAGQHKTMQTLLTGQLKANGRPFGEFVPGGNTEPSGQIDKQIAIVKQLKIKGKNVIVPASLNGGKEGVFNSPKERNRGGQSEEE